VSGYAPNLTVYFKDSSEAHTFPISSYHWNFGDPFNEGPQNITNINSNYYTITNVGAVTGDFDSANWYTATQGHTAVHTYIMPGTYDVTLTVRASTTSTSDICARYVGAIDDDKKFYVYVEEIQPQCNDGIYGSLSSTSGFMTAASSVSGQSPLTAYFMASSIIAGSFPICKIDWDFGDGTTERITRIPLTQETSQGISVVNIAAYSYDLDDPRNIVVPHIYVNQTQIPQTYSINISAYACNTNSALYCARANLVQVSPEVVVDVSETKNLIGSRFDDDGNLIYILEGENNNTTHTVVLSGELNNV
jgi:PKD repeat protein